MPLLSQAAALTLLAGALISPEATEARALASPSPAEGTPPLHDGLASASAEVEDREREPRNVPAMLAGIGFILLAAALWVVVRARSRRDDRPPE